MKIKERGEERGEEREEERGGERGEREGREREGERERGRERREGEVLRVVRESVCYPTKDAEFTRSLLAGDDL